MENSHFSTKTYLSSAGQVSSSRGSSSSPTPHETNKDQEPELLELKTVAR